MSKLERLERQAQTVMAIFRDAGYAPVEPPVIQPADVFLNYVGEALRARTYVFTDPEGQELCLRPDITLPTCLHYLEEHATDLSDVRYSYHGLAFRYQPQDAGPDNPREYWQAGIEFFGHDDREKAEAETLSLTITALMEAGLSSYRIKMGDIELFYALVDALSLPPRWAALLKTNFWRPEGFRSVLDKLCLPKDERKRLPCGERIPCLDLNAPKSAQDTVSRFLDEQKIPMIGVRTKKEVTNRLLSQAADERDSGMPKETAAIIDAYLRISAPPRAALARIKDLETSAGLKLGPALKAASRRLDLFAKKGVDLKSSEFSGDFGRQLEYYSGFMFQIEPLDPETRQSSGPPVAGGGRYDKLMSEIGAPEPITAVGCTIHTERLLNAVFGEGDG